MQQTHRIPLAIKLAYSAFITVMIPTYWHAYGAQNFLYFCDIAALLTLVGMWMQSPLLISMQAVGILLPQLLWMVDFSFRSFGFHLMGMTDYMFNPKYDLFLRGISLFHGWLPILLVWLVYRMGYDRRAFWLQTTVGISVLLICYFGFAPPGTIGSHRIAVNLNFVHGFADNAAQTVMPPLAWLAMLIVGIPALLYWPTHWTLQKRVPRSAAVDPKPLGK